MDSYDLVIIGGGPAGLSAAIYAARFRLKALILTREVGGAIVNTHLIENWPGYKAISGVELIERLREHVESLGIEIKQSEVVSLEKKNRGFLVKTEAGNFNSRTIIFATGTHHRKLNVPGEDEFYGRGVSYCAVCDGAFFRDKTVCVVGGSDSASKEALFLTEYAKKVYIIYRRDKIRAEPVNAERIEKNSKIEIITNSNVLSINGKDFVESVTLDRKYKGSTTLAVDGVFVEIGNDPNTDLAEKLGVKTNSDGVIADPRGGTSIEGFYAAGDVVSGTFRQAIVAAAQGVIAANSVFEYLQGDKK